MSNKNQGPEAFQQIFKQVEPDRVIREIQQRPGLVWMGLGLVTLVFGLSTAFYQVEPDERAVVTRFGRFVETTAPGLNTKLPFGIDLVTKVSTRVEQENFGYRTPNTTAARSMAVVGGVVPAARFQERTSELSLSEESVMLTGDLKIADVRWSVQYQITDPRKFIFNVADQRRIIRDVSIATMRQVVGDKSVYEVLTVGREEAAGQAREAMQRMLDEKYDMGVTIVAVNLQSVSPPETVAPSFNDVNAAIQDKDRAINQAEAQYNRVIPEARGRAEQQILAAEGYATEVTNRARGDAERIRLMMAEYSKAPEVTKTRLYLELVEQIFARVKGLTIVDPSIRGVLPVYDQKASSVVALEGNASSPEPSASSAQFVRQ